MILGHGLQDDAPPKIAVDLNVPIIPAAIDGIAPAFFLEQIEDGAEQVVTVPALFAPKNSAAQIAGKSSAGGQMFVAGDDTARRPFEAKPGEIPRPATHERLRESEKHDQEPSAQSIELRVDPCVHHIRERHAERAPEHEIRDDAQYWQKYAQPKKKNREREPFDTAQITGHFRLRRWINRLKKTFAENSMIDDRPIDEPTEARRSINLAAPLRCAGWAEENQMFESEERFCFAITVLLSQKGAQSRAAMMPHDGSRVESNDTPGLLQPPAKIDIVASRVILDIEAADLFKCPPVDGHVTAGNVLRDGVGEQNMAGSPRRRSDTGLHPILRGRWDIGPAYSGIFVAHQRANQIIKPVRVRQAVGIGVGEHFSPCRSRTAVARVT